MMHESYDIIIIKRFKKCVLHVLTKILTLSKDNDEL